MEVVLTKHQTMGVEAAARLYNEAYKVSLTPEEYFQMVCAELAQSLVNKCIRVATPTETLELMDKANPSVGVDVV
jgi:hypothetical protein